MTYEEFKTAVLNQIKGHLAPGTSLQIQTISKNNGLKLDGLTISDRRSNISPTIFLNYYYDKQEQFPDFDAICRDILLTYEHNQSPGSIDVDFFTDYKRAKDYLAYRIINYEKNKELLETVPYVRYLDLAIVFYCLLDLPGSGSATILIHNSHLKLWHISAKELHEQASQTTPCLLAYDFRNMAAVMAGLFDGDTQPNHDLAQAADSFCPMYMLTNSHRLYGASCMLYPRLLENISDTLDSDLFILPSSIHEVIIIPAVSRSHYEELESMVADINQTELATEEVLSNRIYYYSRAEEALSMCP